jgi:hypothetical protein
VRERDVDRLQKLADLEELRHLKASYFYYLDIHDREAWLSLWAPDATFQSESEVSVRGHDPKPRRKYVGKDLRDVWPDGQDHAQTVHFGMCPLLEVLSDTEAKGVWPMEYIVHLPDLDIHGYGHYHETYRKLDGVWKFQTVYLKLARQTVTQR